MAAGASVIRMQADIRKGVRGGARRLGFAMGQPLLDASNVVLTGARHGRVYRVGGRLHTASAIGEAPAELTGNLRENVTLVSDVKPLPDGAAVTASLVYRAKYAEHIARIRPWAEMVTRRAQPAIARVLSQGVLRRG